MREDEAGTLVRLKSLRKELLSTAERNGTTAAA